jgi:threonine dehydratase
MPVTTPFVKVAATEAHGATSVLDGETVSERRCAPRRSRRAQARLGAPLRRSAVIAGQGTDRARDAGGVGDLDVLVIPIGGGGLIRGNAIAARAHAAAIEIVGVECALYPSMWNALKGETVRRRADARRGIAVKNVGALTEPIVRALVADVLLVEEAHLERAVNAVLTCRRPWRRAPARPGLRRCWRSPSASPAARSG